LSLTTRGKKQQQQTERKYQQNRPWGGLTLKLPGAGISAQLVFKLSTFQTNKPRLLNFQPHYYWMPKSTKRGSMNCKLLKSRWLFVQVQ